MRFVAGAAILAAWLFPIVSLGAFQFSRSVESPQSPREELLEIILDSPIYAHTRAGFSDLRLVDEEGIETPYLLDKLRAEKNRSVRKHLDARIVSLGQSDRRAIELELRLKPDSPPAEGLSIFTPLTDFEHRIRVFGSADGVEWNPLVEEAMIYDYSKFIDLSNRDVVLPPNAFRHLKVRVEEPVKSYESENLDLTRELQLGQEQGRRESTEIRRVPLRIDRIEYWYNEAESKPAADATRDYSVTGFQAVRNEATRSTFIEIRTRREPLTGFTVRTASRNFSRHAAVEVPDPRRGGTGVWREVGGGTLERLNYRALHRENLKIGFSEQRHDRYRIVIRDENNPALEITGVQAHGNGYRLLFFAEPGKTYRLTYGEERTESPVYDTASLNAALRASYRPIPVKLGPEAPGPKSEKTFGIEFSRWINSDLFLGGVIFIVVTVLAVALVYAGKRIDQTPGE